MYIQIRTRTVPTCIRASYISLGESDGNIFTPLGHVNRKRLFVALMKWFLNSDGFYEACDELSH